MLLAFLYNSLNNNDQISLEVYNFQVQEFKYLQ